MATPNEWIFYNGTIVPSAEANIHVSDIGLLRGYGVFDFFRVINGHPVFMEDYLDRFDRSVAGLHLQMPYSRTDLITAIDELIHRHPEPLLGIRLVCTGGQADDAYTPTEGNTFIIARPFQFHPFDAGLSLMTVEYQRELCMIKSTNYLIPISMYQTLREKQMDDVLYHRNGYITESSRSNIFIVKDDTLITPSEGMLEGVTRKRILSFASDLLTVQVRPLSLSEIFQADEVFLSASTKRITPVTKIDHHHFQIGPWSKKLFDRLVEEESHP
jgi:branched-chain amino acid aminotransferase